MGWGRGFVGTGGAVGLSGRVGPWVCRDGWGRPDKRKTDFLMSFRDFAELSFFSRASGDNFLRSFFLTF